jgi:hypothetical protein
VQGSAFAAAARDRAEITVPHVEMACSIICGMTVEEAAAICDRCLALIPGHLSPEEKYSSWRTSISSIIHKTNEDENILKEVFH